MAELTAKQILEPLEWLIGKWKSITAKGHYPTIPSFNYREEMEFQFNSFQPILNYSAKTWNALDGKPMHYERGFLRINPATCNAAFMVSHNRGLVSLEVGTVGSNRLQLSSVCVASMPFVKQPNAVGISRSYVLCPETEKLKVVVCLATTNTPLTEHLNVEYQRDPTELSDKKCV
ncbi:hypothetical protein PPYR_01274 [Photinus pyralis]|uniref:THAP4-like heme-binding domain-containing protein n=1 Tax=Photinus pyralis TaxID=7054 RepID=A0A1Y1LCA9_PHOPY|nr:THAP domain-containing protein 4-like [Photinus pyralis]KAB0804304.1 hypothetical protein PPYR_01274 [Photinus pyralis]